MVTASGLTDDMLEVHGVFFMMAGAWKVNKKAQVETYCDNKNAVEGFKKIRAANDRNGKGVAPELNHWYRK